MVDASSSASHRKASATFSGESCRHSALRPCSKLPSSLTPNQDAAQEPRLEPSGGTSSSGGPHEETTLLAFAVGVLAAREAPFRSRHLPEHPIHALARH